jgi:hypothetical protein
MPNRFALNETQKKYLRRAVIAFFIGCFGVLAGFLSDYYSLKILGQAAFLIVFICVICGIAFIAIGLVSSAPKKQDLSSEE